MIFGRLEIYQEKENRTQDHISNRIKVIEKTNDKTEEVSVLRRPTAAGSGEQDLALMMS